jgi:hypothetical protein
MEKFRKKPVEIEAIQYNGINQADIAAFTQGLAKFRQIGHTRYIIIPTLEGDHRADVGDWIIKGVKNEFYPCKPDIFEMTYESIEEGSLS